MAGGRPGAGCAEHRSRAQLRLMTPRVCGHGQLAEPAPQPSQGTLRIGRPESVSEATRQARPSSVCSWANSKDSPDWRIYCCLRWPPPPAAVPSASFWGQHRAQHQPHRAVVRQRCCPLTTHGTGRLQSCRCFLLGLRPEVSSGRHTNQGTERNL